MIYFFNFLNFSAEVCFWLSDGAVAPAPVIFLSGAAQNQEISIFSDFSENEQEINNFHKIRYLNRKTAFEDPGSQTVINLVVFSYFWGRKSENEQKVALFAYFM